MPVRNISFFMEIACRLYFFPANVIAGWFFLKFIPNALRLVFAELTLFRYFPLRVFPGSCPARPPAQKIRGNVWYRFKNEPAHATGLAALI